MKYLPIDATSSHNANLNILWQHSWKLYRLGIGIYGRYQSTRRYIMIIMPTDSKLGVSTQPTHY